MDSRKNKPSVSSSKALVVTDARAAIMRAGGAISRVALVEAGQVEREADVVRIRDAEYVTREGVVVADEVYFARDAKPTTDGPWLGEADKVAWRDPETGYDCIVLRHDGDGTLGGYVGVPHGHPLWGFGADAIPSGLDIDVHGGITYARICAERPASALRRLATEARRICHVPRAHPRSQPVGAADRDAWWLGFRCDLVHDVIPGPRDHGRRRALEAEVGAIYRDDAYVIAEVGVFAAQLRAVADGEEMEPSFDPPPPPALDPKRSS